MTQLILSRRGLALGGATAVAALAMGDAIAQTMSEGGSWFDMVKRHHAMIVETLDRILATRDGQGAERGMMQKHLAYLLTAHATAEENVIYPALARMGMAPASDQLYIEQAHAKVINADLGISPKGDAAWLRKVADLKTALVHHAKDEEENDLFPKLMSSAGEMNGRLTQLYAREFAVVQRA